MSFDDQIDYFENTTKVIKAKTGEQAANNLLNKAVYFIGMGSNDYINNYLQPFLPDGQQYTPDEFLAVLNLKLAEQFTRLYLLAKDDFSWTRASRMHSFTTSEIKHESMLTSSERMGDSV
ncbi:hypothetical protein L1987_74596 [Smallanthus sonchifolius]|uniref:Uncharacterized protein n=1 Tax=Smallanthus sonchifolius TaxID=185202 RepID=A0ACB9A3I3_9ASTR|nr:hypothetical protein L1987_74596 [Smallanthus sonchifolius]